MFWWFIHIYIQNISDGLLWTPTYGQAKAGRPARTYIQQLCEDTGCNPEDLPEAMNNREKWREVARESQRYPCWRHDMMMMMMSLEGENISGWNMMNKCQLQEASLRKTTAVIQPSWATDWQQLKSLFRHMYIFTDLKIRVCTLTRSRNIIKQIVNASINIQKLAVLCPRNCSLQTVRSK